MPEEKLNLFQLCTAHMAELCRQRVRYQARSSDEDLRTRLVELAREKPRFGYRRLQVLRRRSGESVNHKRVHRVYREAGLTLRRKKRKHCARQSAPLRQYTAANQEWALDFVHDAIAAGRAIRVLSVVDAFTRQCLALEVDTSFASRRVTRVLDETSNTAETRGSAIGAESRSHKGLSSGLPKRTPLAALARITFKIPSSSEATIAQSLT